MYFQYQNIEYQEGTAEEKESLLRLIEELNYLEPLVLDDTLRFSVFDDIDVLSMSQMPIIFSVRMYQMLSKILWDYYYYETFKQLKQRTFRNLQANPTTEYDATIWKFENFLEILGNTSL